LAIRTPAFAKAIALGALMASLAPAQSLNPATFSLNQAMSGKALYDIECASCHGADLSGAGPASPLRGRAFVQKWAGKSADRLFATIQGMPPGRTTPLAPGDAAALFGYLLQANGQTAGDRPVPSSREGLAALTIPFPGTPTTATVTPKVIPPPSGPSSLDGLTPLAQASLLAPSSNDWLHWRAGYDASGFSPLSQINRANVGQLGTVWTWSLPRGDNMMTPIVHNGVLYALSKGDVVEALDGATGDLLWRFERRLTGSAAFLGKKGVAIAGDKVLVPTSDMHVIALSAKTGAAMWDHAIEVGDATDFQIKSAPMVVADKVIVGVNGYTTRGGNFLAAFDLADGHEAWRFHTIARPGQQGGDSWNGMPVEARTGGSVWVSASYDPTLNLIYFGSGATYNTGPLRVSKPGVTNDALYTNATVALNAGTGKLAWFYQHQPNDQLDLDWVFERQLMTLNIDGQPRRVVVTAGKTAIFEALDAATGAYLFSIDMGLQNVVTAIDPKTGAKTLDPRAMPVPGQTLVRLGVPGMCPDSLGARNLMSTSYDARNKVMYAPLTDTCMNPFPNGKRWQKTPDPATDGYYGIIEAVDLQNRKVMWKTREHAPPVSGALATAGDVLFVGDADRWFRAYDAATGKALWRVRLDNVPASYPVTYSIGGRQYVAVATNEGWVHVRAMLSVSGVRPPPAAGATLWVFALPEESRR
jgi:alcohol dehydrogenase (cytochrome c)